MTHIAIGGILSAALLALPSSGLAEACAPRDIVLERLASNYGETRQSIGLGPDSQVVEVFASDTTGTWTITVTRATGLTCLVASGQAFETLAEALPPDDTDA